MNWVFKSILSIYRYVYKEKLIYMREINFYVLYNFNVKLQHDWILQDIL